VPIDDKLAGRGCVGVENHNPLWAHNCNGMLALRRPEREGHRFPARFNDELSAFGVHS